MSSGNTKWGGILRFFTRRSLAFHPLQSTEKTETKGASSLFRAAGAAGGFLHNYRKKSLAFYIPYYAVYKPRLLLCFYSEFLLLRLLLEVRLLFECIFFGRKSKKKKLRNRWLLLCGRTYVFRAHTVYSILPCNVQNTAAALYMLQYCCGGVFRWTTWESLLQPKWLCGL